MAKVLFAPTVAYMSGKIGQGVYMVTAKAGMSYMRNYAYPMITPENHNKGNIMANISHLWNEEASQAYKEQMKAYATEYHALANYGNPRSDRAYSAFAVFVKLIWYFIKADPAHIIGDTVTLTDIATMYPDATKISTATLAGYLPITPSSSSFGENWT